MTEKTLFFAGGTCLLSTELIETNQEITCDKRK